MDSFTHLALGAAVGMAAMGRRTAPWKAAAWGAVCNTLPDLDVFVDHGDAILNVTLHRGNSHALFWLTLASPLIAAGIAAVQREWAAYRRWWLTVWLCLVTHPLLDLFTVYGTQWLRPFDVAPHGIGSIFIVDPLLILPLTVGVVAALAARRGLRWNAAGLALGAVYLAWTVAAQQHVTTLAERALRQRGIAVERLLVTPAPLNSVLWRIVAMSPDGSYHEGFRSLFDAGEDIAFDAFPRGRPLQDALRDMPGAARVAAFSHGFFKLDEQAGEVAVTDLRMGQEPWYTFRFVVARREGTALVALPPRVDGGRGDLKRLWAWLWPRLAGRPLTPPR